MHSTSRRSLNGTPRLGMDRRLVLDAQLDRVHVERVGQFVHRRLDREQARRLARRADVLAARQIELDAAGGASAGSARHRARAPTWRVCSTYSVATARLHRRPRGRTRPAGRRASAPSRTRWLVAGRLPTSWKICCRVSTTLTGCRSSRAASAARIVSAWMPELGAEAAADERRRRCGPALGSIWSVLAIAVRAARRSGARRARSGRSPSQHRQAGVRLHRLRELVRRRVELVDLDRRRRRTRRRSRRPRVSGGEAGIDRLRRVRLVALRGEVVAARLDGRMSTSTRLAAARACSNVVATTSATGSP